VVITKALDIFITTNHIAAYKIDILHDLTFSSSQLAVTILKNAYSIIARKKNAAAVSRIFISG